MKIIKNTASVVLYAGDNLTLTAQHASNGDWIDPGTTSSNAALVDNITDLPADWQGGRYTYIGTTWAHTAEGGAAQAAASATLRAGLIAKIDTTVKSLFEKFAPPVIGDIYAERETAAQAFKDGGYAGTVPARVAEFQVPAGITPQDATDLILRQAAQLKAAKYALEGLRMKKYLVQNAATDSDAQTAFGTIMAQIASIAANLT